MLRDHVEGPQVVRTSEWCGASCSFEEARVGVCGGRTGVSPVRTRMSLQENHPDGLRSYLPGGSPPNAVNHRTLEEFSACILGSTFADQRKSDTSR